VERMTDRYTCEEMFRRLDDFLDRELPPEQMARVEAHLESCAACAEEYAFEAEVLEEVRRKVRRITVPQSFVQRLAAALTRERAGGA
jgi:anti-sigma factor (TIGR02949 family)